MIELILIVLLWLHLVCVNVASAGPLVCLWFEWREARRDFAAGQMGRHVAALSLVLLCLGGAIGLLIGALLWDDRYQQLLTRFASKIGYGVWELVFSLVLMLLHVVWWRRAPRAGGLARSLRCLLPFLAGTNLLYHFPFIFILISKEAVSGEASGERVTAATFRQWMIQGDVLAQGVHFVLASFAVTGGAMIFYALLGTGQQRRKLVNDVRVAVWGARLALVPTLLQVPVGVWLLMQLAPGAQRRLMGGDLVGTLLLALSILLALWLMHLLSAIALGDVRKKQLKMAVIVMLAVAALMTGTLRRSLARGEQHALPAQNVLSIPKE